VSRFAQSHHLPAFSPSDFDRVYAALRALEGPDLAPGRWFCEWGSSLGAVSCLAAMLGFEARGIEAEADLVTAARRLACDFALTAEFVRRNYIPDGTRGLLEEGRAFAWLSDAAGSGYDALGLSLDDFDVVFAFPTRRAGGGGVRGASPGGGAGPDLPRRWTVATEAKVRTPAWQSLRRVEERLMNRKIYVGNLAHGVTDGHLEQMFGPFGSVRLAQVILDRDTGRSKGFGFVEMSNDQEAQAAIAGLNGKPLEGRNLMVNEARPRTGGGGGRAGRRDRY
jgi:hypothetical protein